LYFRHAKITAEILEVEFPVALSHGMLRFVKGEIFSFGIVRAAAERAET
jgi:hypothetical protein